MGPQSFIVSPLLLLSSLWKSCPRGLHWPRGGWTKEKKGGESVSGALLSLKPLSGPLH